MSSLSIEILNGYIRILICNYHILIGSSNINRNKLVDANMITKELFELTVEETLAVEWTVLWLCYQLPSTFVFIRKKI